MGKTATTPDEVRRLRERIDRLQEELSTLQARLKEIDRQPEPPPRRAFRTDFRIIATPEEGWQESVRATYVPRLTAVGSADPRAELCHAPRGTALFAVEPVEGRRELALLVRAGSGRIAQLGQAPDVEFRAGLFTAEGSGVVLVPVLVRIGPAEDEHLYEAWGNENATGLGELLEALAVRESIVVCLHGDDNHLERTLRVPNALQAFAAEARRLTASVAPLSGDAFHQARQAVYKQHPTVWSLWKALKG
jgi:hypothetical protein